MGNGTLLVSFLFRMLETLASVAIATAIEAHPQKELVAYRSKVVPRDVLEQTHVSNRKLKVRVRQGRWKYYERRQKPRYMNSPHFPGSILKPSKRTVVDITKDRQNLRTKTKKNAYTDKRERRVFRSDLKAPKKTRVRRSPSGIRYSNTVRTIRKRQEHQNPEL